jgi:hypothetical protein
MANMSIEQKMKEIQDEVIEGYNRCTTPEERKAYYSDPNYPDRKPILDVLFRRADTQKRRHEDMERLKAAYARRDACRLVRAQALAGVADSRRVLAIADADLATANAEIQALLATGMRRRA